MNLKMLSAKWEPYCHRLNMLISLQENMLPRYLKHVRILEIKDLIPQINSLYAVLFIWYKIEDIFIFSN